MADPTLVLRDIHQPAAPPWWPPAAGWWWLTAALLLITALALYIAHRRRKRRSAIAALFDNAVAAAGTPSAQVAAMSELLRRAARRRDPQADRLEGEAWLQFLDGPAHNDRNTSDQAAGKRGGKQSASKGMPRAGSPQFSQGVGRVLLDGGYRRDVDAGEVAALGKIARARFLAWMAVK